MYQDPSGWGYTRGRPFMTSCLAQVLDPKHLLVSFFAVLEYPNTKSALSVLVLCDEFIWEIWVISETWLDCSKLNYRTCNSTNFGPKNWSMTFKGHKAVLLKAILAKTSNFWPIGPIELKFWHLILKIIHFNISLRRSHGSSFRPLWWLLLGP